MVTPAPDVVIAAYQALAEHERDIVFERLRQLRIADAAASETDMARFLRSLCRVAEEVGRTPTVTEYRAVAPRLAAAGEDVAPFSAVYEFFGTWPRAREALELADTETPRRIEARFRFRELGKVWRYTDDTLRDVLLRAAEHWGRPPSVAEFEWWRDNEQRRAQATGDDADPHLPSTGPYRKRWGTWEGALLHFGFTPEQVAERLEGKTQPHNRNADPYLPEGVPVADLCEQGSELLPLTRDETDRLRAAYAELPRRSRYVLTVRLGLGVETRILKDTAQPLGLGLDRVRQLQLAATDVLVDAVRGEQPVSEQLRDDVIATLRLLASG